MCFRVSPSLSNVARSVQCPTMSHVVSNVARRTLAVFTSHPYSLSFLGSFEFQDRTSCTHFAVSWTPLCLIHMLIKATHRTPILHRCARRALDAFMSHPHPLTMLRTVSSFGNDGAISRYHNPDNYRAGLERLSMDGDGA